MADFTLYMDGGTTVFKQMPDRRLWEDYEKWLKNRSEPDYFIGIMGNAHTRQNVAVYFPRVAAIVEGFGGTPVQQQSPAMGGRTLPGHS